MGAAAAVTAAAIEGNILGIYIVVLLIIFIVILFLWTCKPWRFFTISTPTNRINVDDLERPLISEDPISVVLCEEDCTKTDYVIDEASLQSDYSGSHLVDSKRTIYSIDPHLSQEEWPVETVIAEPFEEVLAGNKPKKQLSDHITQDSYHPPDSRSDLTNHGFQVSMDANVRRNCIVLEVISGPSCGQCCSVKSTDASSLPLVLGRVHPSSLIVRDEEVSGKHASISWNLNRQKWELMDMGSLNGTFLNSHAVHRHDLMSRRWSIPTELQSDDIIMLGSTSKIRVLIKSQEERHNGRPFGVGVATDPMALRRGGKKLPMEDVCFYQWPLRGVDKFGLFGICDGHGGAAAADTASRILPEMLSTILSDLPIREQVVSRYDASNVLRDAFVKTEACMDHLYEGCTATVLLVWAVSNESLFVQCANVGDSACLVNANGEQLKMTEDHRITNHFERSRINETGVPLKDGETRLFGINLSRMLGDKFLKQEDNRFLSEPYISKVVHINQSNDKAFALLASDGLWDVISVKRAFQLVAQAKERGAGVNGAYENEEEMVAKYMLSEARTMRSKDNTCVLFIDLHKLLQ